MSFAVTQIDLEIILLSKVNQKGNQKYHMMSHMWYIIYLKYETHERTYEIETNSDTENRLVVTKAEVVWEGSTGSWELANTNYYI